MLAPLAGYTNLAYRAFMKKFGCDLVVSEMISDYALIYQNEETFKMIKTSKDEKPVGIQIFGGQVDSLIRGVEILQNNAEYDFLDINLGCPVHKVTKNNSGSAWLKNERKDELLNTIKEIVKHSSKPVTAKIRLGWDQDSVNVVQTCKILEEAGVSLITIHGRLRSQLYSGKADYSLIKEAKENCRVPIIANGDITTLQQAIDVINYTKCDGIAIGRGCLGNPTLIKQIAQYYKDGTIVPEATIDEQMDYLLEHYHQLILLKGEYAATQEIRGIAPWYLKKFSNVKEYKVLFTKVKSEEEFNEIVKKVLSDKNISRQSN